MTESVLISFMEEITSIRQQYAQTGQLSTLRTALAAFAEKRRSLALDLPNPGYIADLLLNAGDDLIRTGDPSGGILFIRAAETQLPCPNNKTLLYLRLGSYHLEKGEGEAGQAYLIKLCTDTVDNYEEAIALNGLTDLWEKYKPLVAGIVPPSVPFNAGPVPPAPGNMHHADRRNSGAPPGGYPHRFVCAFGRAQRQWQYDPMSESMGEDRFLCRRAGDGGQLRRL